ncbi:MAG TPA: RNA 2',3'-cyclic phosphodiesterase [Draconibacterium sp.]|nr:RNA 2',3'-cyclic phosphodiesterase [Draconibacterium sp.]HRX10695.1 RNA 2',3'-cyclic phosphodiesterase [Draconibacterium sp.]
MKETIRTFIAIKIKAEKKLLDLIGDFKKSFAGEEIRWVNIDNLHITLRFLGETSQIRAVEIVKMLELISTKFQPFQFKLKGVSVFKRSSRPQVLLVQIENDPVLKQLALEIDEMIKPLGFRPVESIFKPHLTLARIKYIQNKGEFNSFVNRFGSSEIQTVTVSEIIFYQSILGTDGPTYKAIKIVNLN